MKRPLTIIAVIAATALFAVRAAAQQSGDSTPRQPLDGRLRTEIAIASYLAGQSGVPEADRFQVGPVSVPANTVAEGPIAVARGNLDVFGRVNGDAVALHGDIIVHPGGSVGGNAIAIDGRVRPAGGVIEGDVRSLRGVGRGMFGQFGSAGASEPPTTWGAVKMVFGWFAVLFVIGVAVLLFAEGNLNVVVTTLEQQFTSSFWTGLLAQIAAIPALLLVLVGLAITVVGILLVPFAIVAYALAIAGLIALGFIAVARLTGRPFLGDAAPSRATSLRALFAGLIVYVGLWLVAALFVTQPIVGSILRTVALAATWVGLTVGLGATVRTRVGTRSAGAHHTPRIADDLSWQTPTPVTGVSAARRPIAPAK